MSVDDVFQLTSVNVIFQTMSVRVFSTYFCPGYFLADVNHSFFGRLQLMIFFSWHQLMPFLGNCRVGFFCRLSLLLFFLSMSSRDFLANISGCCFSIDIIQGWFWLMSTRVLFQSTFAKAIFYRHQLAHLGEWACTFWLFSINSHA